MSLPIGSRKPRLPLAATLGLAAFAWAAPLAAQEPQAPAGREHVVRRGDTLWDLASFYLSNPYLWGLIYDVNRQVVENPHWIYPAERLRIPPLPPATPLDAAAAPAAVEATPAAGPGRTVFYADAQPVATPAGGVAGEVTVATPAAAESSVQPGDFYASPWLSEPRDLEPVAELIRPVERRHVDEKLPPQVLPYNRVYLRYRGEVRPAVGDRLLVVRPGRSVDRMGRVIRPGAILTVSARDDEVMTAVVTQQFGSVQPGDLALPLEAFPGAAAGLLPVEDGPEGELIAFVDEQPMPAVADRAFIDLGLEQGLAIGDELIAYLPERRAGRGYSETAPPESIARLRVVRVEERTATVRVVSMSQALLRPGLPVRLVGKVP